MVSRIRRTLILGLGLCSGCALRGDVRKVELQVEALRAEMTRSDSARRVERDSLARVLIAVQATISAEQNALVQIRGDIRSDLQAVQQQLMALQELTGQSQQRLSELRSRLSNPAPAPPPPADTTTGGGAPAATAPVTPSGGTGSPGPDQMYDLTMQQYRRGSFTTARLGFREFLRLYPNDERASDVLYFVGESFAPENPDSASAVYQDVVKRFPNSPRAPSALYKLGLLAQQRGDKAGARTFFARVLAGYPRSDEANLARDRLQALGR
ncbi:MAG TPA: tetratricopeptide repeat protein [Gemmatimonadales bacterium]|nr:tetratricopeptide repeat protein [Gemmatimonadales bacterium]